MTTEMVHINKMPECEWCPYKEFVLNEGRCTNGNEETLQKEKEMKEKELQEEMKVRGKRAKIDVCIDWLIRLVAVMSLLMTGFSAGHGDYLVAFSFATGLVNAVLLMTIRKEMKNGQE